MSNSTASMAGDGAGDGATERRRARLSTLATAPGDMLRALWAAWLDDAPEPRHEMLRAPEIGTVMVRGRAGASGAPFNLGEMTVTRASARLEGGAIGHGHVQGRDREAARIAALVDALSEAGHADALDAAILAPLRSAAEAHRRGRAERAAATKVEFFTLVRGDNA